MYVLLDEDNSEDRNKGKGLKQWTEMEIGSNIRILHKCLSHSVILLVKSSGFAMLKFVTVLYIVSVGIFSDTINAALGRSHVFPYAFQDLPGQLLKTHFIMLI